MTKEAKIILGIGLAVVVSGILLFRQQPKPAEVSTPVDSRSLVRENSHMTGTKDAKVTIVEFGDYQCPACAAAAPSIERLRVEYANNQEVNFVFRHFPLPQHSKALAAANAAEAAGEQGKFWEMTAKIYETQNQWESGDHQAVFANLAQQLGLNVDIFKQVSGSGKYSEVIRADQSDGESLGVNSTPTFFINGEKYTGAPSYDNFKRIIEEKLK